MYIHIYIYMYHKPFCKSIVMYRFGAPHGISIFLGLGSLGGPYVQRFENALDSAYESDVM